jgi:Brp/Blh family beta-carotene 15,15'-monooxygenase
MAVPEGAHHQTAGALMFKPDAPPRLERLFFVMLAVLTIALLSLAPHAMSLEYQLVLLLVLIAFLGLPHGALDPWVAQRLGWCRTTGQTVVFNIVYLAIAAGVVLIWLWQPVLSLLVFLLISAWHFADDWRTDVGVPARVLAGSLLLLLPIGWHPEHVAMLFGHLSGQGGADLAHQLALPVWTLVLAVAGLAGYACWLRKWFFAAELVCLLALAAVSTPLIYFVIYFCGLHSPRHLLGLFRQAGTGARTLLVHLMVTYTAATFLLAALVWWLWPGLPADTAILKLVFIGLAALTVPHMMLVARARYKKF